MVNMQKIIPVMIMTIVYYKLFVDFFNSSFNGSDDYIQYNNTDF